MGATNRAHDRRVAVLSAATVSVVIPVLDAESTVVRAVESVFAASAVDVRVVLVDDGSTDGTAEVARDLVSRHGDACRVLAHPGGANRGVSESRNLGIRSDDSDWVAFLDADDLYLPGRFDVLLDHVNDDIDGFHGLASIRVEQEDRTGRQWLRHGGDVYGLTDRPQGRALLEALASGVSWHTSAITLRRSLLRRTGLFDPGKRIAEDFDLWLRTACAGRIVAAPGDVPTSVYCRHGGNTYHYDVAHRLAMLCALLDGYRWARGNGVEAGVLRVLEDGLRDYATRAVVAALDGDRPDVARALLAAMLRDGRPSYFLDRRVCALTLAAWRGGRGSGDTRRAA